VVITVSDGSLTATDPFTFTVSNTNRQPVVTDVTITPTNPLTNATLNANVTASDPDGDALTTTYQWTRNGTDIAGATSSSLFLGGANNGDRGDNIRVRVRVADASLQSDPVTSGPVTIGDSAPTASVVITPLGPGTNATVTATVTASDADNDAISLHYEWKVNGITQRTVDKAALTDTFDLSVAGNGDGGDTVRVEVTPSANGLAGALASDQVTVAGSGPTVYASDHFARTVTDGWGSAGTGGAWTISGGGNGPYDVTGNAGTMNVPTGGTRTAALASVSAGDVDMTFRFASDKVPTGGALYVYGQVRRVSATAAYWAKVRVAAGGAVYISSAAYNSSETVIGTEVRVTGLNLAANSYIRVRVQVQGTSPTTIRMRAWADGSAEPNTWQYTGTNSLALLQGPGSVGLRAYTGSALTNGPIVVSFDDLDASSIGP
jgi:hypothetical protein